MPENADSGREINIARYSDCSGCARFAGDLEQPALAQELKGQDC
jgi:hypothetical protein